jgi:hypothetical protein
MPIDMGNQRDPVIVSETILAALQHLAVAALYVVPGKQFRMAI